jgi:tetratricopeptide (TPR) repeat protein
VELGFLEKNGKGPKIKVELVRLWLLKNYPLLTEDQRKRRKNNMTQPKPDRPNAIAQFIALIVMVVIGISFALYLYYGIISSGNSGRTDRECSKLSEEINNALQDKKNTTKQSQVIKKVRTEWSREKKGLLDKQCPYPSKLDPKYNLDAEYNRLLQNYGRSQVDTGNFDEGIEAFCEITSEYKNFSDIKKIFLKWVLIDKRLSNETTKRLLNKIIEQNQSGNDCLAYSFKDDRNKNELYDQKAQAHTENYEYENAVKSYCKITRNYHNFEAVVKQLEKWLSNQSDQPYWMKQDVKKVEEKLKELKNQCPALPPSLDN